MGALIKVGGPDRHASASRYHEAWDAINEAVQSKGYDELDYWNNDPATDDFEVIDTLRHVAKELRNEASV